MWSFFDFVESTKTLSKVKVIFVRCFNLCLKILIERGKGTLDNQVNKVLVG
jgi:hypothetical protein